MWSTVMLGFGKVKMSNHDKWRAILLMRKIAWSDPAVSNDKTISDLSSPLYKIDHKSPQLEAFLKLCGKDLDVGKTTTLGEISKSLRDIYLIKSMTGELPLGGLNISNDGLRELKDFTKVVFNPAKAIVLNLLVEEVSGLNLFESIGSARAHDIDPRDALKYGGDMYSLTIKDAFSDKGHKMDFMTRSDLVVSSDLNYVAYKLGLMFSEPDALNRATDENVHPDQIVIEKNGAPILTVSVELNAKIARYLPNVNNMEILTKDGQEAVQLTRFLPDRGRNSLLSKHLADSLGL
jgi:hypothetical protein